MNPFLLSPNERILEWRNFRQAMSSENDNTNLISVAKWFSQAPIGERVLDYYCPQDWPTPWECLHDGEYCKSMVAYLMEQTFLLSESELANKSRIQLLLVEDIDLIDSSIYLMPLVDDVYLLNYSLGELSDFASVKNNLRVLKRYFYKNDMRCEK